MPEPKPPAPAERGPAVLLWIRRLARLLVIQQSLRRSVMFYLLAGALACVLVGGILFPDWLRHRPLIFLAFWLSCAVMTLVAVVLACFDLILVRLAARVAQRVLREQYRIEDDSR
jgi:hypothetical protein